MNEEIQLCRCFKPLSQCLGETCANPPFCNKPADVRPPNQLEDAMPFFNAQAASIPREGFIAVFCAWCTQSIAVRPITGESLISHGICPTCYEKIKARKSTKS